MIGMLHRGEADFAVEKFLMSPARLQAVDFISTLEQVKYGKSRISACSLVYQ
jgi:hypothetical protein